MSTVNNVTAVLPSTKPMSMAEMQAAILALTEENAKLKAQGVSTRNGLKVSTKGAISLYGMGRFPITMYAETWEKVLNQKDSILSFIADEKAKGTLSIKAIAEQSRAQ